GSFFYHFILQTARGSFNLRILFVVLQKGSALIDNGFCKGLFLLLRKLGKHAANLLLRKLSAIAIEYCFYGLKKSFFIKILQIGGYRPRNILTDCITRRICQRF